MLQKILGALLPAVITVLLGYFAARHHDFKQKEVPTLNRMVMGFALPMLLFIAAVSADRSELVKEVALLIILAVAFLGMYGAIFLLCRLVFRFSLGESALGAFTASAPSTGFVGPVVLGHLYGEASGIPIALGSVIIIATMLPLTIVLLSLDASENEAERERLHGHQASPSRSRADPAHMNVAGKITDALKQPVVWLPLVGFAIVLTGLSVPKLVSNSLTLLAHASAGVALFASGIILAGYKVTVNTRVLFLVFVKNVLQPALVLLALLWLGYGTPLLDQAVLTCALPVVVIVVMLGVQ